MIGAAFSDHGRGVWSSNTRRLNYLGSYLHGREASQGGRYNEYLHGVGLIGFVICIPASLMYAKRRYCEVSLVFSELPISDRRRNDSKVSRHCSCLAPGRKDSIEPRIDTDKHR